MVKQCIEAVEQVNRKRNKWKRDLCFVLLFKEEIFSIIWNGDQCVQNLVFKESTCTILGEKKKAT